MVSDLTALGSALLGRCRRRRRGFYPLGRIPRGGVLAIRVP